MGYTSAGKSSLENALTGAGVLEDAMLFSTLDTTTRSLRLADTQEILLSDTVGFIRKLPHHLVEAFKSTLEEARYCDIVLNVVDCSDPQMDMHMHVVKETLRELGITDKTVVTVFNKTDKLEESGLPITKGFFMHVGIDDFGAINSSRGADYGNYILKSVAGCMKECLSDKQRIYHLVADQYVIVDLEASSAEDAVALKEKITDKLHNFIVTENYEAIFSISIGVIDAATFCEGTEECRKKFEFALKQAKSMGKNGFYVFDQNDYEDCLQKGRIVAALRNAIVNNYEGFEVNYQPIVDCQSEQIIGAEALMRFSMITEEGREFVSPMEFIPLLEETGLIIPAGRYILNEAAAMCCEMQKYIPDFRMNVNVSYVQILQGNVERDILDAIQKYSLQTECLCVEMTESGFMDMTPSFCKFRKTLDKNGIPFVIDDFWNRIFESSLYS